MLSIQQIIEAHTASVQSCTTYSLEKCCPKCHEKVEMFKRHDSRERSFRFIVGVYIYVVKSLLLRWKCPICGKTFTDYPFFAAPHKRYVVMDMERLSAEYLEDEQQSYRKVVNPLNIPIGYHEPDDGPVEHLLAHSTPWRWIHTLGSMKNTLTESLQLVKQKDPTSPIFREACPVIPDKYHSSQRKSILENARHLLRAGLEFHRLFGHKIFPYLETVCSRK